MRLSSSASVTALAAVLLAVPSSLPAQSALNQGFWFGFGLGAGYAKTGCEICVGDHQSSYTAYFRLGTTINPGFLLGAEGQGWMKSADGIDRAMGSLMAVGLWYPNRGPWFLKGGLGIISDRVDDDADALTSRAFGAQIGFGYEFQIGKNTSLLPFVNGTMSMQGNRNFNGSPIAGASDTRLSLFQIGLGMTWH